MLFEGDVAKGVLSPEKFSELLKLGKIKFPTVTLEEIEDRSKASGFSNTIAIGQALRFFIQYLTRRAEHFDLTLVEQLTLSYTVLNGVMYFLWWHKPLDVRSRVRVNLLSELPEEDPVEPDVASEFYRSLGNCYLISMKLSHISVLRCERCFTKCSLPPSNPYPPQTGLWYLYFS